MYQFEFVLTATSSITSSSRANLFTQMAPLRLQRGGNLREQYLGYIVDGGKVHPSFVIAYCVFKFVCGHALSY
jgi:hypothetical protein